MFDFQDRHFNLSNVRKAQNTMLVHDNADNSMLNDICLDLAVKLVAIGGYGVASSSMAVDAWILTRLSTIVPGKQSFIRRNSLLIAKGKGAQLSEDKNDICHAMSAIIQKSRSDCTHFAGYALSADGLWHEHSWIVTDNNQIIETTGTKRLAYVGVDVFMLPQDSRDLLNGDQVPYDEAATEAMLRVELGTYIPSAQAQNIEKLENAKAARDVRLTSIKN